VKKVLILVEGQTEEAFVKRLLHKHLLAFQIDLIPCLLHTKLTTVGASYRGGVTSYAKMRRDIMHLLDDSSAYRVTTMLDYYGLPKDFPGLASLQGKTPYARVKYLEKQFAIDIAHPSFIPYLMLHEFEAFLFVDPTQWKAFFEHRIIQSSSAQIGNLPPPEEINNGAATHPSQRICKYIRNYKKTVDGPPFCEKLGLNSIRTKCPHFHEWLEMLEQL